MEQTAISQRANPNQRIIYVEPNDVFDVGSDNSIQNEQLTPKYEDFCISFNLIIEAFNRFKQGVTTKNTTANDSEGKPVKYMIQWGTTREEMYKKRSSVLQGNRGPDTLNSSDGNYDYSNSDYNYLTTYYTDISFDSYNKKTEIEGLGVESVQISYESWYTPTVTIKFVDVRGSALWGREEAIHIDEKLTAENIFGAFFTMPYPLFRLQVKGFLGKPVTYQLTCSNFKGEFNSQTGNFEAVATFIGYSWSLMTDIPFMYLVAAPYSTYIGYDYWEEHKNTDAWALWNDGDSKLPPPKLFDLFDNINSALTYIKGNSASEEQSKELRSLSEEQTILRDIQDKLGNFVQKIEGEFDNNFFINVDEKGKEQLILFSDSETKDFKEKEVIKKCYQEVKEAIENYEKGGFKDAEITKEKVPNGWNTEELPDISFIDRFNVDKDSSGKVLSVKLNSTTDTNINADALKALNFNETDSNKTLTDSMADFLVTQANEKSSKFKKYCYLIDLFDVRALITKRFEYKNEREAKITKDINEKIQLNVIQLLNGKNGGGFKPFIGNVFKIIFCHLETFCHIMLDSAKEIYDQMHSGQRTPQVLGLGDINQSNGGFEKVDIIKNQTKDITPWPAIFNEGVVTSECGYRNDIGNIYGWVGDLSKHNFIEEKVVYSIQEGIQLIVNQKSNTQDNGKNFVGFPILPSDFSINRNIFGLASISNVSDLAGHLANRIGALFGIMLNYYADEEESKLFGRLDAYNLYSTIPSVSIFTNLTQNLTPELLRAIMFCDPSNEDSKKYATIPTREDAPDENRFTFEKRKNLDSRWNVGNRHPFFVKGVLKNGALVEDNDKCTYVHYYGEDLRGLVPATLKKFDYYESNDGANADKSTTFKYKYDVANPYFIPNNREKDNNILESSDYLYIPPLSSISDEEKKKYINKYMFSIVTDNSEIATIKNKYSELKGGNLKVGQYEIKDDLSKFLKDFVKIGSENTYKFFETETCMLSGNASALGLDTGGFLSENMNKLNYDDWVLEIGKTKDKNNVRINENGELTLDGNAVNISDLVIQQFKIYVNELPVYNLFGTPFYYLQNDLDNDIKTKIKALLFLHTFKYNFKNINIFKSSNATTREVPKGYLLLLGGLLWKYENKVNINFGDVYKKGNYNREYTLLVDKGQYGWLFQIRSNNSAPTYKTIEEVFNVDPETIDGNIKNQLIALFEEFAEKTFTDIINKYELKNSTSFNGAKKTNEEYTYASFVSDINAYFNCLTGQGKKPQDIYNLIKGESGTTNLIGNYTCISVPFENDKSNTNKSLRLLLNEEDKEYQNIFKDLYFNNYIVCNTCIMTGKGISIHNKSIDSYLNGFVNACKDISSSETVSVGGEVNLNISKDVYKNRDLALAIYYYLKNLWDKWLVTATDYNFDVSEFFEKNFVFTDSFYINTYHELAINCEKLLEAWTHLADNGSLFHFLSRVCTDHGCLFLPVPDYVGFNGKSQQHDIEMMENLFRPLPYNSIDDPSNSNKFVVMYTHSPSHVKDEQNGFPMDSYDIWSHKDNQITSVASKLFKSKRNRDEDSKETLATREGYNVPSFGVAFGKQNNHIFKNLKVTMDNPVMTEQAIKAQYNIAKNAGSSQHTIAFIGQDIFNVFTNYSYSINVEMMGNAQICPLMYFQLMNIPMWRGTYMIYKVVHNMTPGDMTTTITAMKMNKYAQPFNTKFFTELPYDKSKIKDCNNDNGDGSGSEGGGSNTITTGDTVGLVGDSYAVGMSDAFIKYGKDNNINAKAKKGRKKGNIEDSDTVSYSQVSAKCSDKNGVRNAINDGCNVIIIHLGLNNFCDDMDVIISGLENSIKMAKQKGAKVFLCIPIRPSSDLFKDTYKKIVEGIKNAATKEGAGVIDLTKLQTKVGPLTERDEAKLHPTVEGYRLLANEIIQQLIIGGVKQTTVVPNPNGSGSGGAYAQDTGNTRSWCPSENTASADGRFQIGKGFSAIYDKNCAWIAGDVIGNRVDERLGAHAYTGKCTRGPQIVLQRSFGIECKNDSKREEIFKILKDYNFKLKFYGKIHHTPGGSRGGLNKDKSCIIDNMPEVIDGVRLQVGDFAFSDGGGKHSCIWSGKRWVSDCWQKSLAVHPGVTENVWIWSYKYSGQPIDMTPNGNSQKDQPWV